MNEKHTRQAVRQLNEIVTRLNKSGNDLAVIIGLVSTALQDNRENELYQLLCDMMPEYTDQELLDVLLKDSVREN